MCSSYKLQMISTVFKLSFCVIFAILSVPQIESVSYTSSVQSEGIHESNNFTRIVEFSTEKNVSRLKRQGQEQALVFAEGLNSSSSAGRTGDDAEAGAVALNTIVSDTEIRSLAPIDSTIIAELFAQTSEPRLKREDEVISSTVAQAAVDTRSSAGETTGTASTAVVAVEVETNASVSQTEVSTRSGNESTIASNVSTTVSAVTTTSTTVKSETRSTMSSTTASLTRSTKPFKPEKKATKKRRKHITTISPGRTRHMNDTGKLATQLPERLTTFSVSDDGDDIDLDLDSLDDDNDDDQMKTPVIETHAPNKIVVGNKAVEMSSARTETTIWLSTVILEIFACIFLIFL